MIEKIRDALGDNEEGKCIGVLGLTFKPETDDMRDAPALSVLPALIEKGAILKAHDPQGMREAKSMLPSTMQYCDDPYAVFEGADAVVLMTEWNLYRGMHLVRAGGQMREKMLVDLRNAYEPNAVIAAGFAYSGVGR